MHWLSFLIGALVGWLIGWLIDYLICRPRRIAAEAEFNTRLEQCDAECAALREQLTGYRDLQVRLDAANAEIGTLQAQVAGLKSAEVRLSDADLEIDSLKAELAGLKGAKADLVSWKAQATQKDLEIERLNAELAAHANVATAATAAGIVAAADAATPETGVALTTPAAEAVEPDDLVVIEGIGPKISALLNENGVYTFAQLATTPVERLRAILEAAGPRFRLADPQTWPEQAAFARDGKWDALQTLQDTLKAGRNA